MQHTAANSLNTRQQTTALLPCSAPSIRHVSNVNRNIWHPQTAAPFPSHHCDEWMSHQAINRPFFFFLLFFLFSLRSESPEPYRGIFPQMMKQRHSLNSVAGGLQPFLLPEPSQHMAANHAPHRQPCRSRTHWIGVIDTAARRSQRGKTTRPCWWTRNLPRAGEGFCWRGKAIPPWSTTCGKSKQFPFPASQR